MGQVSFSRYPSLDDHITKLGLKLSTLWFNQPQLHHRALPYKPFLPMLRAQTWGRNVYNSPIRCFNPCDKEGALLHHRGAEAPEFVPELSGGNNQMVLREGIHSSGKEEGCSR